MTEIDSKTRISNNSKEFFRDESSKVIFGGLASGLGGMAFGSMIAIKNNDPFVIPAISTSLKSLGFGTSFFALRQFLVKPLVDRNSSKIDDKNVHFDGILSTFISGGLLGGSINGYLRGRSLVVRSGFTVGLMCSSIHFTLNELSLLKDSIFQSNTHDKIQHDYKNDQEGNHIESDNVSSSGRAGKERFWEVFIPLKKLSDEEFRIRLKDQLSEVESKRKFIEDEILRFENAIKTHSSNSNSK